MAMSNAQIGGLSFFGGLAKGLGNAFLQKKQKEQAEKDAQKKMLVDVTVAGINSGDVDPNEAMPWLMQQMGIKDKDGKIGNLMKHAGNVIPTLSIDGQDTGAPMPKDFLPLDQSQPQPQPNYVKQDVFDVAAKVQSYAPPSTNITLPPKPAPAGQAPMPHFRTPAERQAAEAAAYKAKTDIDTANAQKLEDLKAQHAVELAKIKNQATKAGTKFDYQAGMQMAGVPVDDEGDPVDVLGNKMKPGTYQTITDKDGTVVGVMPTQGRADNSPLARKTKLVQTLHPEWSDDQARTEAARQIDTEAKQRSAVYFAGRTTANALSAERLKLLQQMGPLNEEAARLHLDTLKMKDADEKNFQAGDPKTILAWGTRNGAALVTNPDSAYAGGDPVDATRSFLKEHGYDYDDLTTRAHQAPQPVSIPDLTGGGTAPKTGGQTGGGQPNTPKEPKPANPAGSPAEGTVSPDGTATWRLGVNNGKWVWGYYKKPAA